MPQLLLCSINFIVVIADLFIIKVTVRFIIICSRLLIEIMSPACRHYYISRLSFISSNNECITCLLYDVISIVLLYKFAEYVPINISFTCSILYHLAIKCHLKSELKITMKLGGYHKYLWALKHSSFSKYAVCILTTLRCVH